MDIDGRIRPAVFVQLQAFVMKHVFVTDQTLRFDR
jgi:hypothetical protein